MLERRKSVRIPAKLAMEIKISGKDLAHTESINVSANGVYFSSPTYIPVLTKLEVKLSLPSPGDVESSESTQLITCEGVVVRSEPEQEKAGTSIYEIACYFTSIHAKDKDYLDSYILRQISP
jgi:c-di-GMP-binding flagellar brake protein YcgR